MTYRSFRELTSWQSAKQLVLIIYQTFHTSKDYSFKDQIQSAALSSMSNIAEGYARYSDNELRRFLYISLGSVAEVSSLLDIALELKYIDGTQHKDTESLCTSLSKQLHSFIQSITKRNAR